MNPLALTGPSVEPVSLAEMKTYLRVDSADEDDLIGALVGAARLTVERATRLSLLAQGWRLRFASWPRDRAIALPIGPILSVDAVRVSTAGGVVTLASSLSRLIASEEPARLLIDASAPDPMVGPESVSIDLTCGFGTSPVSVPEPLRLAVRRLVAHWYERRGDETEPASTGLPAEIVALLGPFVRRRLA